MNNPKFNKGTFENIIYLSRYKIVGLIFVSFFSYYTYCFYKLGEIKDSKFYLLSYKNGLEIKKKLSFLMLYKSIIYMKTKKSTIEILYLKN